MPFDDRSLWDEGGSDAAGVFIDELPRISRLENLDLDPDVDGRAGDVGPSGFSAMRSVTPSFA